MQRRKFLKDICRASIVCTAPSSLITLQSCSENDKQINGDLSEITINLNDPTYNKLNTVGQSMVTGSTDFDISGLLLLRKSKSDLLVYSRQCPHAGTSINAFLNGAATCPNHGAKFKTDGSPVPGGPTNAPLKQYTVDFNYPTATVFR
tara:strand:+ start:173 stop:616 length:444 start_codon:yes stop_codon:yes gene_type:complete